MNRTESLDQVYVFDLQRIPCSRVPRMLRRFSPAVVSKKRLSIFIPRARSRPPCAFSGVVLLRSQVRRALLGRCNKVPVSARGFRKQWQQRDLLPESAVSGRPLQGLSPLPDGPHAGRHSSRHGAGPLPWCCLALMTGGLWRHRSRTPPSLPPTFRPHIQCCFSQFEPKIICTRPAIIFCFVEVGLTALSTHYTDISEGFWDPCNFHLPCLHSMIMDDMTSAFS